MGKIVHTRNKIDSFPRQSHIQRYSNSVYIFFLEIGKVRGNLFQINGKKAEPLQLPDADGPQVSLSEKVYVPIKDHPDVSCITISKKEIM